MSRRSLNRDRIFQKAKNQDTLGGMLSVLEASRHMLHKRVVPAMRAQVKSLSTQAISELKKKEESQNFEKLLMS